MSEHKFRYLLPPGNNFQFVSKFKSWLLISSLLMAASIGALFVNKAVRGGYMNWTIDFRGGTEIIVAFKDKTTNANTKVDAGVVRKSLEEAGESGVDVSEISWDDDAGARVDGMMIRTPRFSAMKEEDRVERAKRFREKFAAKKITLTSWSGDRLNVHSLEPITHAEANEFFKSEGLEVKPWATDEAKLYTQPDEGTREYHQKYSLWGIDRQYELLIEKVAPNVDTVTVQSYGVGAKAGDKLRDDAIKSIIYAIMLIMLYLAFRFDIRYAPGAAFATIHDAIMVIGVFAVTWTEVSLSSVAGLLTVVGFSVNDTVVVFDRIRENQAKLKDKKIEKVVDISINEVLVRSILTSVTVFATTLIMNIFGTGLVANFAFAMNVGVIVGSYSSIFLAAPFFLYISKKWYSGPAPARRRGMPAPSAPKESKPEPESDEEPKSEE